MGIGRYDDLGTAEHTLPDGRVVIYRRRRLLPQPESLTQLATHVVRSGERVDHIAAAVFGDPEAGWRLADANRALRPDDVAEPGRRLRVTLPFGLPGGAAAPGGGG